MNKSKNKIAKVIKKVAERVLTMDANSTTCTAIYQPKTSVGLARFKKTDNHD